MRASIILLSLTTVILAQQASPAPPSTQSAGATGQTTAPQATASKTDIGSILKTIDAAKLASIPANARAVMKKMPEEPSAVTMEDRSAIKGCIADQAVDKLGKLACMAQDDQLVVLLDKKRVSNANMRDFVREAIAAGGKMPAAE